MLGAGEDFAHGSGFHDLSGVHDRHAIRDLSDDAEIVRNHQDGHPQFSLKPVQKFQNLGLNGHVQRRGGLVGDEQFRIAGERNGNHHPLAHAAGKLVRIFVCPLSGIRNADQVEHVHGPGPSGALAKTLVEHDGFVNLVAAGENRVEACHRLLENHRDVVASYTLECGFVQTQQIPSVEPDLPRDNFTRRFGYQTHQGQRRNALAASGLSHQSQCFPLFEGEGDPIHGFGDPAVRMEIRR